MKRKVICDTNVWYHLGSGAITLSKLSQLLGEDYELYATWVNIIELAYSYTEEKKKNIYDFQTFNNACKAIKNHAKEIIKYDPFEWALYIVDTGKQVTFIERDLNSVLDRMINSTEKTIQANYIVNKEQYDFHLDVKRNFSNGVNLFITEQRVAYKSKNNKERTRYISDIINNKEHRIDDLITSISNSEYGYEIALPSTEKEYNDIMQKMTQSFELWIETYSYYLKKLIINCRKNEEMKVEDNDFYDLFNMLYVGNDDLYLYGEKRWRAIFDEAKLSQKCLYSSPNSN